MGKEYKLGPLSQIPEGEGRVFMVKNRRIAVFHDRGARVYATQAECPHLQGPLADGLIGAGKLVCPLHDRIFDLVSGTGINNDCEIKIFQARCDQDNIIVSLD